MKFALDQTVSHDRQRTNHKNNRGEGDSICRVVPMGDCTVQSDTNAYTRHSDSVSCWGDVPKRPTRLTDLLNETGGRAPANPLTASSRTSVEPRLLPDSTSSVNASNAPPKSEAKSNKKPSNPSGTAGRERLLEWLRASQAKRDENNRQVFTRWIDKLESMRNQSTTLSNLSPSTTGSMIDSTNNTAEFQSNCLYQFASSLPGSLTTPAVWIGNPVGLPLGTTIPNTGSTFKLPNPLPPNYLMSNFATHSAFDSHTFPQPTPGHAFSMYVNTLVSESCQNSLPETDRLNSDPDFMRSTCVTPLRSRHQEEHGTDETNNCPEPGPISSGEEPNVLATRGSNDLTTQNPKTPMGCGYMINPFSPMPMDLPPSLHGAFFPPHMCISPPSTVYDPAGPQLVCYCYMPTPVPSPQAALQTPYGFPQPPVVPRPVPGNNPPLVYLAHAHGSHSPVYTATSQYNVSDSSRLESSTQSGIEQTDRSPGPSSDPTNEGTVDLCGTRDGDTARPVNQTPVSVDQSGRADSLPLVDTQLLNRPQTTFDFDLHKWYAVLSEAASAPVVTEQ